MWLLAATYKNAAFLCSHIEAPESGIFSFWAARAIVPTQHELAQYDLAQYDLAQYKSAQHALNHLLIFLKL